MPYHFLFLVFVILDLSFQFTLIFSFFSNMEAISLRVLCAKFVYRAYLHNLFHKMIKIWTIYVDCLKLRPRQPRSKQTLVAFWKVELTWAILHLLAKKKKDIQALFWCLIFSGSGGRLLRKLDINISFCKRCLHEIIKKIGEQKLLNIIMSENFAKL